MEFPFLPITSHMMSLYIFQQNGDFYYWCTKFITIPSTMMGIIPPEKAFPEDGSFVEQFGCKTEEIVLWCTIYLCVIQAIKEIVSESKVMYITALAAGCNFSLNKSPFNKMMYII